MRFLAFAVLLAGACALPPAARGQAPAEARWQEQAVALLGQSPLLKPGSSAAYDPRFVRDVRATLAAAGVSAPELADAEQATAALEKLLERSGPVKATITSSPSRVVVTYRRLVDASAPELSVTTNDSISVAPAIYLFTATDPRSGRKLERKVHCGAPCRVDFSLR